MVRLALAPLLPFLIACATSVPAAPVGHATPLVPGIRIIKGSQAAGLGMKASPFELRFGDQQDGTKLVLDFLAEAKRSGARFVSDIQIELRTTREGVTMLCSTELVPVVKQETEVVPYETPGHYEQRWVPKTVTASVTENTFQCQTTTVPVTRMETSYQYQYDYLTRSSRSMPVTRTVTTYQSRQDCRMVPVTRIVTRYESQLQTRFVPPSISYLVRHYTDFDLMESRPRCRPATDGASSAPAALAQVPHRIVGMVYRPR